MRSPWSSANPSTPTGVVDVNSDHWTVDQIPDQTGKVALVTGANSGLGLEIARVLSQRGAKVVLGCRNPSKAEQAKADIEATGGHGVAIVAINLADLCSVEAAAEQVLAEHDRLDLLANNAGLMAVDQSTTADGFETQLGVNHLGHFALTMRLLPLLDATPGARIVTMSSMGHRMGRIDLDDLQYTRRRYDRWLVYSQSKLANLLFTAELDRRLREVGSTTKALTAHPGASRTDLGAEGTGITNRLMGVAAIVGSQPAAAGALPFLRAATDPAATGGEFYGPHLMVRGRPIRETPSRRARNSADARGLWQRSEQFTGLRFPLHGRGRP